MIYQIFENWSSLKEKLIKVNSFPYCVQTKQRRLDDLNLGRQVIAKHKNGRYYHANIVEVQRHRMYEVDFDDGSVSDDLLPEDIVVSELYYVECFQSCLFPDGVLKYFCTVKYFGKW